MRGGLRVLASSNARTVELKNFEFELWRGLARVYADGLKDDARRVDSLRFALSLRPEATDVALELASAHAHAGDAEGELDALREVSVRVDRPEVWRRLLELYRARDEVQSTWAPLSFLVRGGHATREESADLLALRAMPVTSPLDANGWSLLTGTQEDVEAMELIEVVAPLLQQVGRVPALPRSTEPWAGYALGLERDAGTPEADTASRFRSGLFAVWARPGVAAARELGLKAKPKALLFACFQLCGAKEPIPIDVRLDAIAIAIDLRPLLTPAILERLSSAVRTLKHRGTVTLTWFDMAERIGLRAGLLLSGDLSAAEDHLGGKRPRELAELLEFAASPAHGELRRLVYGGGAQGTSKNLLASTDASTESRSSSPFSQLDAIATRLRRRTAADADFIDQEAEKLLDQILWMLGKRGKVPGLIAKGDERAVTLSRAGRLGRIEIRWSAEEGTMHLVGPRNRDTFRWDPPAEAFLDTGGRAVLTALDEALDALFAE